MRDQQQPVTVAEWEAHADGGPDCGHDLTSNEYDPEVWTCGCGCLFIPSYDGAENGTDMVYADRYVLSTVDPAHDCPCHTIRTETPA